MQWQKMMIVYPLCVLALLGSAPGLRAEENARAQAEETTFEISYFMVEGNTLLPEERLQEKLKNLVGPGRTAADVEKGRDALEKLYHDDGYPTVLVNIPEQSVDGGVIRLQVIESRIGRITVSGNRYFSTGMILERLPGFSAGKIIHVPTVQREIGKVNRNPDLKVIPNMVPSREVGVVDVDLKVEDALPLHGSLEANNRSTQNTTGLRLNGALRYDNLWQREHSLSLQYQLSPEELSEVEVFSGSYMLPAPWADDHKLVLYGVWSDSETGFGEGFRTVGKGNIIGGRYLLPLAPYGRYNHSFALGIDYKDFEDTIADQGGEESKTPISYVPWSFAYSSTLPDKTGITQFNGAVNLAFRRLGSDQGDFDGKRVESRSNYIYLTAGVERTQSLPLGFGLMVKADGQLSSQPLISNEQFVAGGMESVRGYRESEKLGDNGFHGTVELSLPDLAGLAGLAEKARCVPYLFYDAAVLHVISPLDSQESDFTLQGTGAGVRGHLFGSLEYQLDVGVALEETESIKVGDSHVYFRVKYAF